MTNTEIAGRLGWTNATVGKWRRRFLERRLPGLYDELRPGRPRTIEDEKIAALLKRTLSSKPKAGTHWTVRDAARANGVSKSTVHRLFQAFAVQPHRTRTFKLSNDPFFVEKVRDIAGLYLNPPDHALVLCVDEKSQIQALNRTQPVLPMGLGYAVMAKELTREEKLRPFGVAAGEKISDPRNYLFVDYSATLTDAALTVLVRTSDGKLYASDLGRADVAIARSGYVRTTVELPPGTTREKIAELSFECRVAPPAKNDPSAHSGQCVLGRVSKLFLLQNDYTPGKSFWQMTEPVTLSTGRGISFKP